MRPATALITRGARSRPVALRCRHRTAHATRSRPRRSSLDLDIATANLRFMESQLPRAASATARARQEPQEPAHRAPAAGARRVRPVRRDGLGGDRHGPRRRRRRPHRQPARRAREATGGRAPGPRGERASSTSTTSSDAEALSAAAVGGRHARSASSSRSTPGCTAAGWTTPDEALAVARRVTGAAGSAHGRPVRATRATARSRWTRRAPRQAGRRRWRTSSRSPTTSRPTASPCPILSAAGTATAFWTGADPRITELQLGSYAAMDDYHFLMEPRFRKATTAVVTVISRRRDRVVLDLGKKTFGSADVGSIPAYPRIVGPRGPHAVPLRRGARHLRGRRVVPPAGRRRGRLPPRATRRSRSTTSTPTTSSRTGIVVDIWPIMPRGPLDGGLLAMLEAGR